MDFELYSNHCPYQISQTAFVFTEVVYSALNSFYSLLKPFILNYVYLNQVGGAIMSARLRDEPHSSSTHFLLQVFSSTLQTFPWRCGAIATSFETHENEELVQLDDRLPRRFAPGKPITCTCDHLLLVTG